MKRALGAAVVLVLIGGAVWIGINSGRPAPPRRVESVEELAQMLSSRGFGCGHADQTVPGMPASDADYGVCEIGGKPAQLFVFEGSPASMTNDWEPGFDGGWIVGDNWVVTIHDAEIAVDAAEALGVDAFHGRSVVSNENPVHREPKDVDEARAAILEAAEDGDYEELREILEPETFLSDFGYGVDPIDRWARMGAEPLDLMAVLLRMDHVTEHSNEGRLTRWPVYDAETRSLDEINDRDRDLFLSVMSMKEFRRLIPNDEYGYVGPRLGILENGTWWFFIMELGP